MTESEIQRSIIKTAESMGCIVIRMNAGKSGRYNTRLCPPGTPDLLIVGNGFTLWVEVKDAKGKLRDTQKQMHKDLSRMGHNVVIARSVDDVLFAIKEITG